MVEEEDTVEKNEARGTVDAKSVSVEDLNDALLDETDDSEAEGGITIRKRRDTVDTDNEEFKVVLHRIIMNKVFRFTSAPFTRRKSGPCHRLLSLILFRFIWCKKHHVSKEGKTTREGM